MFTKRSWESFYDSFIVSGAVLIIICIAFFQRCSGKDILIAIGLFVLGWILLLFGVYKRVKYYKETHKDTQYKIDDTCDYIFTLQTAQDHIETVHSYQQMEEAVKKLDQEKSGCVEIKIQPPMGGIKLIDVFYEEEDSSYAHIWILQEREDGEGYWVSNCDKAIGVLYDLKQLYVKHKQINYRMYSRRESGE